MQYTLRNVPPHVDHALRQKADEQGKSLNQIALETLGHGLGLDCEPVKRRDLSDLAGSWVSDPEIDAVLAQQREIDPGAWE